MSFPSTKRKAGHAQYFHSRAHFNGDISTQKNFATFLVPLNLLQNIAKKIEFSMKNIVSKCEQIHRKPLILHKFGALRDLVPFVQFKKRKKHPWRSVHFSQLTLLHGCFSCSIFKRSRCTNGTKSRNASQIC